KAVQPATFGSAQHYGVVGRDRVRSGPPHPAFPRRYHSAAARPRRRKVRAKPTSMMAARLSIAGTSNPSPIHGDLIALINMPTGVTSAAVLITSGRRLGGGPPPARKNMPKNSSRP